MTVYITVIGSSSIRDREVWDMAYRVGYLIAKKGGILVCGGRGGVMEAAAKGAKDAGGTTVGILPGFSRNEANPYIDIAIPTGMSHARNAINVLAGDSVIVIHGGPGTLSEVGLALAYGKPVIALKNSGGVASLLSDKLIGGFKVHGAGSPEEAVEKAFSSSKSV
ncbi:MAG: TIGR00725 family protein [Thermoprotei archaeon]|nr:MAG: TIGR00725 family protein [Thermoprotei archaeon]HDI74635.1 TIGR00725 family protein [Thermoprotei archaeon]